MAAKLLTGNLKLIRFALIMQSKFIIIRARSAPLSAYGFNLPLANTHFAPRPGRMPPWQTGYAPWSRA
jgi:hypothetical protein